MIPKDFLHSITKRLGVSDNELEALQEALKGNNVDAIAQQLDVTREAIQKRLGEVYKKFQIEGKGPGKLTRLQQQLMAEYQKYLDQFGQVATASSPTNEIKPLATLAIDSLSPIETQIIYTLALTETPLSLDQIQKAFVSEHLSELLMALGALLKQSLVEQISKNDANLFVGAFTIKQWVLHQCKQFDISLDNITLEQYPKIYQQLAKSLNQLGYETYCQGDLFTAKFNLKLATNLQSNFAAAHYNLGSTYEQLQQNNLAKQHYQIAVSLNKKASDAALCNLARLDILDGNIEQAIERIKPALKTVKDDLVKADLLKNLGWAYLLKNDLEEAEISLQEALTLNPNKPVIHCLMAQVLEAKKQEKEALQFWQNVLEYEVNIEQNQGLNWQTPELIMWRLQAYQRVSEDFKTIKLLKVNLWEKSPPYKLH
jgi:tetratricopeptide (TPR) repeat protein